MKLIVESNAFAWDEFEKIICNFSRYEPDKQRILMDKAVYYLSQGGWEIDDRRKVSGKYPLMTALKIGDAIVRKLSPYCVKVAIAGSIRRKVPFVKDIEIVCQPMPEHQARKFDLKKLIDYTNVVKDGDRYKQLVLSEGIKLDLFIVLPPAQWGVIFAIRTGGANFSKRLVTNKPWGFLPVGYKVKNGAVWKGDEMIKIDEEDELFRLCGIDWIDPIYRS